MDEQILLIFQKLTSEKQTEQIFEFIQAIRSSIHPRQRTSRGIVWALRQIRTRAQEVIPISLQRDSIEHLLKADQWEVRALSPFIIANCCLTEGLSTYIPSLRQSANDHHFGVRETTQSVMRELMQDFPEEIIQLYDNDWLDAPEANVRRCVSESLRPVLVNGKNWIRENPQESIKRLKQLNRDSSLYVRKSVGNNLSDISRRHPELVLSTLQDWLSENEYDKWTWFIARKACRRIIKTHPTEVKTLLKGKNIIK